MQEGKSLQALQFQQGSSNTEHLVISSAHTAQTPLWEALAVLSPILYIYCLSFRE